MTRLCRHCLEWRNLGANCRWPQMLVVSEAVESERVESKVQKIAKVSLNL